GGGGARRGCGEGGGSQRRPLGGPARGNNRRGGETRRYVHPPHRGRERMRSASAAAARGGRARSEPSRCEDRARGATGRGAVRRHSLGFCGTTRNPNRGLRGNCCRCRGRARSTCVTG